MKARHLFAAIAFACGIGHQALAQEPKQPEAKQEAQQEAQHAPAPRDAAEQGTSQEKPAKESGAAAAQAPVATAPAKAEPAVARVDEKQEQKSSPIGEIKITDVLIALFTGILVLLGWTLARRMREAVGAAKDSAAIAEKSARVAEDALIAGQRAFMFIREIKTILHQDPDTGKFRWTIHPVWANSGNTPTRSLSINTAYRLLDEPLSKNHDFSAVREDGVPTIAGPRSMVEASPGEISDEDLAAVQEGRKFFYIWGEAEYHDIFEGTKKRITRFCNQLIQVDGDPSLPDNEHNPVQMMFGFHTENNYAD